MKKKIILVADEIPICEEIKNMALLPRLRNLFHFNRETEFNNGDPQSENHQPFNPIFTEEMIDNVYSRRGDTIPITQIPEGGVCYAQLDPNVQQNIIRGQFFRPNERGLLEPLSIENMEHLVNSGETVLVSLDYATPETSIIRVNVRSGTLNLAPNGQVVNLNQEHPINTGNPSSSLAEAMSAVNQVIEAVNPLVETITEAVAPISEIVESLLNDIAIGSGVPIEQLREAQQNPHPEAQALAQMVRDMNRNMNQMVRDHAEEVLWRGINPLRPQPQKPDPYLKYDKNYPHICFKCKNKLQYKHALGKAIAQKFTEKQFKKMWKTEQVEFYCCYCIPAIPKNQSGAEVNEIGFREMLSHLGEREFRPPYIIATPHPEVGREVLERMREANFRWGPGYPPLSMISSRNFRLEDSEGNILYQDSIPGPVFISNFRREEVPHHQETITFEIILRGNNHRDSPIFYHQTLIRQVNTPLPEEYHNLEIQHYFDVDVVPRIEAIGQIISTWLSRCSTLRIGNIPEFVMSYINRIITHDYYIIGYYEQIVAQFRRYYPIFLQNQELSTLAAGYHERLQINQVHLYGGIVDGERLEVTINNEAGQRINGVHCFAQRYPEITSLTDLNHRAIELLNRRNPFTERMELIRQRNCEHEMNADMHCRHCGLAMVEIDRRRNISQNLNHLALSR